MKEYAVTTPLGTRIWHADDADHAVEQHDDAFPDEPVLAVSQHVEPKA